MANVMPKPVPARIQWCENHVAPFTTNATSLGINATIATDFQTKTEAARAALAARDTAEDALRNANNDLRLAMIAVSDAGAGIIKAVRGRAETVGDSVYSLASIPVPATPAPRPAPGEATGFKVELQADGSINVSWKCDNSGSSGTQYQVWRRIGGGEGEFTFMAGTGEKKFVDYTIPAGSSQVTYQIRATRPTGAGPWAQYNVNFGVGTPPTVVQTAVSPKMAA